MEVRRYDSRLAAEATVEAGSAEAGRNEAFRLLFNYISGANQGQSKVAMTAPVEVGAEAEKIAMTVPVETAAADYGRYTMRFFFPSAYTKATAPEPTDPRVRIVKLPEVTVAVRRFSGSWDEEQLERRKSRAPEGLGGVRAGARSASQPACSTTRRGHFPSCGATRSRFPWRERPKRAERAPRGRGRGLRGDQLAIPGEDVAAVVGLKAVDHFEQTRGGEVRCEKLALRHVGLKGR